jgi:ABC-2 type transport system permease protein
MSTRAAARRNPVAFPYLLLPGYWASRNRARRATRGDIVRAQVFSGVAVVVFAALFYGAFWVATQLGDYAELGDFLLRIGLSWLFLTFLSFLAFSGVVTALSTLFLSEDLRLLLAAPVGVRRLFYARFSKIVAQSSWMVAVFLMPVLLGIGVARCAPCMFYVMALLTVVPFCVIPVTIGTAVTLLLVNVFPARRARDILMLMGLLFAASIVLLLRYIQPERLLRVESLPDVTGFFATLQSPLTPMLPSFWAGETLFTSLTGGVDVLHASALWMTAGAFTIALGAASERWYFSGFSKSQEARKARFTRLLSLDRAVRHLPVSTVGRTLFIKDVKVFLRDVTQWSQLLLLLALVLVYLYNFHVLDLDRVPYMSGVIKNVYAFLNLGLASFVLATIAVRFVFTGVSAEGQAFWIIRTSPVSLRSFLWSKFWMGLIPLLLFSEVLTIVANDFLGVATFLKCLAAIAIVFISVALVGLATGMGARYPRFNADNPTQVAGSPGGVAYMISAVCYILFMIAVLAWPASTYLWHAARDQAIESGQVVLMFGCFALAAFVSIAIPLWQMHSGVRALEDLG